MAATLKVLFSKKRTITLNVDTDDEGVKQLNVIYNPRAFTTKLGIELTSDSDEHALMRTVDFLMKLLVSWDLLDNDTKEPLPITADLLLQWPIDLLNELVAKINEAARPNVTNAVT